jgi:hypothetical protein
MQQRYYDPQIGTFLSVDPVTPNSETGESFNRFAYANGNPLRFVDPDGRASVARTPAQAAWQVAEGGRQLFSRSREAAAQHLRTAFESTERAAPRVVQGIAGAGEAALGLVVLGESLLQATVDDDASNALKGIGGAVAVFDGFQSMRSAVDGVDRHTLLGTVVAAVGSENAADVADIASAGLTGLGTARAIDVMVTTGSKRAAAEATVRTAASIDSVRDAAKQEPNQ